MNFLVVKVVPNTKNSSDPIQLLFPIRTKISLTFAFFLPLPFSGFGHLMDAALVYPPCAVLVRKMEVVLPDVSIT